jgi:hypothetical protein
MILTLLLSFVGLTVVIGGVSTLIVLSGNKKKTPQKVK